MGAPLTRTKHIYSVLERYVLWQVESHTIRIGPKSWRNNGRNSFCDTAKPESLSPEMHVIESGQMSMRRETMNRPRQIERQLGVPPISISRHVVCKIMCSVGAHGPETGGILL